MPIKIFYSWQSDRPARLNKTLIRRALDKAVEAIGKDPSIEKAYRDFEIDQDTQGVLGAPIVSETILEKIREADLFIADLTFIDYIHISGGRRTPNPNVMLEYGYALRDKGWSRIISVLNEFYGPANDLPFDLRHRRFPLRYNAPDGQGEQVERERKASRNRLAEELARILRKYAFQLRGGNQQIIKQFKPHDPADGIGSIFRPGEIIGVRARDSTQRIRLGTGGYSYLRLMPSEEASRLEYEDALRIIRDLPPLGIERFRSSSLGRSNLGYFNFSSNEAIQNQADAASFLLPTCEIWGINFEHLSLSRKGEKVIAPGIIKNEILSCLKNYLNIARDQLKLSMPLFIEIGLANVNNYVIATADKFYPTSGRVLDEHIIYKSKIESYEDDIEFKVSEFLKNIYNKGGLLVGERQ